MAADDITDADANGISENSDPHMRILLIEDSAADILLVRIGLEHTGIRCELSVIEDGQKAIAFLESVDQQGNAPTLDLILLDMNLPKCGGGDILKRLRSTKRYAGTPVIVMSGSESPADYRIAQQNGAQYFPKPSSLVGFIELGALVRGVFDSTDDRRAERRAEGGAA